jgi:hypothetical protein
MLNDGEGQENAHSAADLRGSPGCHLSPPGRTRTDDLSIWFAVLGCGAISRVRTHDRRVLTGGPAGQD